MQQIERLVLTHKDRLLQFGAELIFTLCEIHRVEVLVINQGEELSFEEELAQDVLEIITVFSAHIAAALCIGRRSKGFSEKLPYNWKVILSFSKSFPLLFHVPVRNRDLDKWKMLKEVYKKYQAAHVEHFRAVKNRSLIYGLRDAVPRNIASEIPARESLVKLLD